MIQHQITNLRHPWVQHAAKLARCRTYRSKFKTIIIGGNHIVREYFENLEKMTLDSNVILLAATPEYIRRHPIIPTHIPIHSIDKKCVEYITREPSPEGIIAEVKRPLNYFSKSVGHAVILVEATLPGNVGALVRSAMAFGWDIVLAGKCTDPFTYEAIRCSKGSALYSNINVIPILSELSVYLRERNFYPILASLDNNVNPKENFNGINFSESPSEIIKHLNSGRRLALILGSESVGLENLPMELKRSASTASIVMKSKANSLNVTVAGSILMHTLGTLSQSL